MYALHMEKREKAVVASLASLIIYDAIKCSGVVAHYINSTTRLFCCLVDKRTRNMRENKSVNITFRVTSDFKKKLAEFCEEGDLSSSFVIRQALLAI